MAEDSLEDSDDIYKDLDTLFSSEAANRDGSCDDVPTEATNVTWTDYTDVMRLPNPTVTLTSRMESERKKLEMDLLLQFVVDEGTSRKAKLKMDPEYQELQKEVARLQNLNSEKDAQILELTTQNVNLKKNICSLYKTAKSEVEQKDMLLTEANNRLDFLERGNNRYLFRKEQYSQTDNKIIDTPETSPRKSKESATKKRESDLKNKNASRKRSLSPSKEEIEQRNEKPTSAKKIRAQKCDSNPQRTSTVQSAQQSQASLLGQAQLVEESPKSCAGKAQLVEQSQETLEGKAQLVEESPEAFVGLEGSQAAMKENDPGFDSLPETVKRSFIEYELSQIESLSRLKQSFVHHYFVQSKIQVDGVGDAHVLLQPDTKSTDSTVAKQLVDAKTPGSSPAKEGSDSDVTMESEKEITCASPVNHLNDANPINERTENSSVDPGGEGSNSTKTKKHCNFNDRNRPDVCQYDIVNFYRQKKEKMPTLLKRQVLKYHRQTKKT